MKNSDYSELIKLFLKVFTITIMITTNYYCSTGNDPIKESQVAIYCAEDKTIKWEEFLKISNKDSLKFTKFISAEMIDAYDYSSHVLYLNSAGPYSSSSGYEPQIFAVCVGDQKIYYLPNWYPGTTIHDCHLRKMAPKESNIVLIEFAENCFKDIRKDDRIKSSLMATGKYRGGLEVEMESISSVMKNDSLYFKIDIKITNINNQNLHLIDPSDIWHGRSIGGASFLQFWNKDTKKDNFYIITKYDPSFQHRTIMVSSDLVAENLVYIKKGESINRTYTLPKLSVPYGEYHCAFYYDGVKEVTQQQISLPGGRVWVGNKYSNVMDVTISKTGLVINNKNVVLE